MKLKTALSPGLIAASLLIAAGCNKTAAPSNMSYQSAINDYYQAHPVCLWQQSKKFPVQEATSDDAKTQGYDALTDAGMLTRTTAEKKVMIVASKQVNNYDISANGRNAWVADPNQPGYGNFCYGHRDVTSIDNVTNGTNSTGAKSGWGSKRIARKDLSSFQEITRPPSKLAPTLSAWPSNPAAKSNAASSGSIPASA